MNKQLRILHLEDNPNEAELLQAKLEEAGMVCEVAVVETREAFLSALERGGLDLILSDFTLPSFDGKTALGIARKTCPEVPFIFVSGTIGEEAAIESMVNGATDYVLKGKLSRLIPAVRRALHESEAQRERKRVEGALIESEEKYKSLFERTLAGMFVSTPEGTLLECNPAYLRMFGFASLEEAKAMNISLLYSDPEKQKVILSTLKAQKKIEYLEVQMVKKDGTPLHVIKNVVGRFDERGELLQVTGYLFDDTKRQLLEQQLIQAQKLESLGTLAGGIAHDFNNILGIIIGHAALIRQFKIDPEGAFKSIETITSAAQRGAALVRQLLTFARKSDVIMQRISMNGLIKDATSLFGETFPKTVDISTDLQDHLPPILADSTQMHQVLINLCVNARDAMPDGGKLGILTRLIEGENIRSRFPKAKASQYVLVEISDTGVGMNAETRRQIFEPFFTTKEPGKGTGLGLAVAFGIMEIHFGFIDVASEPGRGTTFSLYFPVNPEELEPFQIKKEMLGDIRGGTETILFVEDEEMLRALAKTVLTAKGYAVIAAADGREAVEVYARRQKEIALVVCDMGLPKLDGYDVLKQLKHLNTDVKFILASGYIEPAQRVKILEFGAKDFIQKPYVPNEMIEKIRDVLDEK